MEIGETLEVTNPDDFVRWLDEHGGTKREIWVFIYKKTSGKQRVSYQELVDVSIRFGWIDGLAKSVDAEKWAQRFSPRRKGGNWTEKNKGIARRLIAVGVMTEAGKAALPPDLDDVAQAEEG